MDVVSKAGRSRMMAGIRSRGTKPELALRRRLFRLGYRYRLHNPQLPGKPDIAFPGRKAVIFVHGCFWHRHQACRYSAMPASNADFWMKKFSANVERDRTTTEKLMRAGWRVTVVWECELRSASVDVTVARVAEWLEACAFDQSG
jgi:DNA mismatch endonuclease (patch repair protein)